MYCIKPQNFLACLCYTVLMLTRLRVNAQITTTAPLCESTGHRCIRLDQCNVVQDGQYQWCGGCENHVRCLGGVGTLFTYSFYPYIKWDDNRKNYELTSNTCRECYYPCTGPSVPTKPTVPACDLTGLGCLNDACTPGAGGNFQYCGNCTHYVTCSVQGGVYNLVACPGGSFYDDFRRTCVSVSTTCFECYATCSAPTTQPPTTLAPTTLLQTTQAPEIPAQTSDLNLGTPGEPGEESTEDLSTDGVTATTSGGGTQGTTASGMAGIAKFVLCISTTLFIIVSVAI